MTDPLDDLRRYAADLTSEVSATDARRAVNQAFTRAARRPRRVVVALVSTALFGLSNVALAATANPSVPGDALYGIDRAYDRVESLVGIGGLHTSERFEEADALIQRGNFGAALELVQSVLQQTLDSEDPSAAIAELEHAVDGPPTEVQSLLDVARSVGTGEVSGADVAAAAKSLVDHIDHGAGHGSPSGTTPSGTAPAKPGTTNPNQSGGRP